MILLALLIQAAQPAPVTRATAAPPERFSILLPAECPTPQGRDVVVCGDTTGPNRLPLPDDTVPDHPVASNPYKTGSAALAADDNPCATLQGGCQVGFGPPLVPMAVAAVRGVKSALQDRREARARARDGDRRQPIDLAATAPAGRLEP